MLSDAGLDQFLEVGGERGQRAFLVLAHEPRIARNVGGEDGGESTFSSGLVHRGSQDEPLVEEA